MRPDSSTGITVGTPLAALPLVLTLIVGCGAPQPPAKIAAPSPHESSPNESAAPTHISDELRAQLAELYETPRHRPPRLDEPPQPSRIKPGNYACRVSKGYKLRDCVVERDSAGHTMLEVLEGNLVAMRGVLYNDGSVVRFEGWPTERRPFKCFGCQERCFLDPPSCGCQPRPPDRIASCLGQPIHALFKGKGRTWKGVMIYRDHFDPDNPLEIPQPKDGFHEWNDRFELILKRR